MASQTSFLAELVADLYKQYHQSISQLTIILPHERSGQALAQCLTTYLPPKTILPKVLSIEAFVQQLSPLEPASPLLLTHMLYQTFQALQQRKEPFEQFYFWGSLLLEDFDVIDKYLVNAVHLFTDLGAYKAFSLSYDYLTEAQRVAVQSFWKNFEKRLSTQQKSFLQLWKQLPQVYQHFGKRLYAQGIGYPGLCYKAAYEALLQGTAPIQHKQLVFAGFNALTPVEEKIMVWCQAHLPTTFRWDVDAYYMDNTQQEAGLYLRKLREKTYFKASFPSPSPRRIAAGAPKIHITEVTSKVGQAQAVGAQLKDLMEAQGENFVPSKIAIIVADETLCLSVLRALPLDKVPVSTHLGYPLKDTATYRLLEHMLVLQIATDSPQSPAGYLPIRQVLMVLKHPYVMEYNFTQIQATITRLQALGRSHVTQEELVQEDALYAKLFKIIGSQDCLISYLIEALQSIEAYVQEATLRPLEKMAFQQLVQQLVRLQELLVTSPPDREALLQLLRQLVQPIRLSVGELALDGVQVLDVFATQSLDFDHVFIVGMNEGYFPAQDVPASFIPYNLRKGYGLPTSDQYSAALYAYYFYRLLQRAQQIYITYSTQTISGSQEEMSRYLLQLLYESKICSKKQIVTQPIHLVRSRPIVISKKEVVLHQLWKYILQAGDKVQPLTPTALNTYLDCSLRFYFQYLAKLKVSVQPQRATHALVFGSVLHKAMEKLYTPLLVKKQGQLLQSKDLEALQEKIPVIVREAFSIVLQQHQLAALQGDHTIVQAVVIKLVSKILALDQAYIPFALIGLEMGRKVPLSFDFSLDVTTKVRLQGIIDRVDWKAGVYRVLDYKTGADEKKIKSTTSLFERAAFGGNRAAFQTFFYAWLFQQKSLSRTTDISFLPSPQSRVSAGVRVMPGLLNTRQLFNTNFDPRFFVQQLGGHTLKPIEDVTVYQKEWEEGLRQILTELLNPAIPFFQVDDVSRCTTCPYKGICERH